MADTKISALTDGVTANATDRIPIVRDPSGTPVNRYITPAYVRTYIFTQGTITADAPMIDGTVTWNNAGVTFTGWKLNVTSTASASASLLADLQVAGVTQFNVRKDGLVTVAGGVNVAQGAAYNTAGRGGIAFSANGFMQFYNSGFSNNVCFKIATTDILDIRNNADNDYSYVRGRHRSHANATAETPTATHTIRHYDAAGTEYKLLAVPA